jgi:RNA polymerase sigma factor (sigma-70 family)
LLQRDGLTDGQLLARFVDDADEGAFELLVERHGPMVRGVCRRVLGNSHDADDAFQATFLVLVRKAASLQSCGLVGNWLYGVAYNTALAARARTARRRTVEALVAQLPEPPAPPPTDLGELRSLLDQELSRLAAVYREAVILCDLEGRTRKEVARSLGVPEGTISSRLAAGRRRLARRLSRHALALTGLGTVLLPGENTAVAVPPSLAHGTVKAAAAFAVGPVTAEAPGVSVAALAEGVLQTMHLSTVKSLPALVLAFALAAGGALVACHAFAEAPRRTSLDRGQQPGPAVWTAAAAADAGAPVVKSGLADGPGPQPMAPPAPTVETLSLDLPAGELLALVRQSAVQEDIQATPEQVQKIAESAARLAEAAQARFDGRDSRSVEDHVRRIAQAQEAADQSLKRLLTPVQQRRAQQIYLQEQGLNALQSPQLSQALHLTGEQQQQVAAAVREILRELTGKTSDPMWRALHEQQKARLRTIVMDTFTAEQREVWCDLVGRPFRGQLEPNFNGRFNQGRSNGVGNGIVQRP